MDRTRHQSVSYVQGEEKVCLAANEPHFRRYTNVKDGLFEVEMSKKRIRLDLPIQLGFFILSYAKMHMLAYYYDCVDKFVDRSDFVYCEMDTDSAYMALSKKSFAEVVKSERKVEYNERLMGQCNDDPFEADGVKNWFPRECCSKHKTYDKRTPGLFKKECEGDEIISLSSKSYIVRGENTQDKVTCKGVNKNRLTDAFEKFWDTLVLKKSIQVENAGIRPHNGGVSTYTQSKIEFSYFYCKREVNEDGKTTKPLDIVLCPYSRPRCDCCLKGVFHINERENGLRLCDPCIHMLQE